MLISTYRYTSSAGWNKTPDSALNSDTFAGDIPQGGSVYLMRANFERLIEVAADAAGQIALKDRPVDPLLTVAISCVGRKLVLSQRAEEEIEAVIEGLPSGSELVGYYSYGELSPLASGRCDLHNQTMTLTSFWEYRAQSTEHRAQSTEHRAQSTEHRAQSTERRRINEQRPASYSGATTSQAWSGCGVPF